MFVCVDIQIEIRKERERDGDSGDPFGWHVKGEAGDVEKARKCKETPREGGEASREGNGCLTEMYD